MGWRSLPVPYFRGNLPFFLTEATPNFVQRSIVRVKTNDYPPPPQTSSQTEVDLRGSLEGGGLGKRPLA